MNRTSKDIADHLVAQSSLGLTLGTDVFLNSMPSEPDNCITIYDLPGAPPKLTLRKGTSNYYYPSIAVHVRNQKQKEGYDEIFAIYEFLHGENHITINSTSYQLIRAINEPHFLEWDENDRAVYIVNFDIQRK